MIDADDDDGGWVEMIADCKNNFLFTMARH